MNIKTSADLKLCHQYVEILEERYILNLIPFTNMHDAMLKVERDLRITMDDDSLDTSFRHDAEAVLNNVCVIIQMIEEDAGSSKAVFGAVMGLCAIGSVLYVIATAV